MHFSSYKILYRKDGVVQFLYIYLRNLAKNNDNFSMKILYRTIKNSYVEIQICIPASFLLDFMRPKIRTNKFQIKNQNQFIFST